MTTPRLYRTEAVILKRTDFGEADRILTLYTPHLGKLRAIAKGVRRPRSRLGGHVELFIRANMLLARGRNLDIVTQSENIDSFIQLREDLHRASYAYYIGELLDQFTEDGLENYPLYELLITTLKRIASPSDPYLSARYFELHLLDHLGYRPQLHQCVQCTHIIGPEGNTFSSSRGGVLCARCSTRELSARRITTNCLKMLRLLQSGDYATASRVRLTSELRHELQSVIRHYIECLLERQLKSTTFLDIILSSQSSRV